jgi:hypothetical protein
MSRRKALVRSSKVAVIEGLMTARAAIHCTLDGLSEDKSTRPFLGEWSVQDLVAHLVGWDYTNLEAVHELLNGRLPSFYAQRDAGWRTYNAGLVARYGGQPWARLLQAVEHSRAALAESLRTVPESEFGRDRGLRVGRYRVTIERLLLAEAADELRHADQLRKWAASVSNAQEVR